MTVLVAGANGQVGRHLTERLAARGHAVRGMVRDDSQVSAVESRGAEAVVADLTVGTDVERAVDGCDAAVFAAGSGGDDVWGVDRDGAIALVDAAADEGADRFVMLSAINADSPEESPEALREYLRAKGEADEHLRESDLTDTIVRPGSLTDDPGTGRIRTGRDLDRERATIPREDVAHTLAAALPMEGTYGRTFEVLSGDEPIEDALEDPLGGA